MNSELNVLIQNFMDRRNFEQVGQILDSQYGIYIDKPLIQDFRRIYGVDPRTMIGYYLFKTGRYDRLAMLCPSITPDECYSLLNNEFIHKISENLFKLLVKLFGLKITFRLVNDKSIYQFKNVYIEKSPDGSGRVVQESIRIIFDNEYLEDLGVNILYDDSGIRIPSRVEIDTSPIYDNLDTITYSFYIDYIPNLPESPYIYEGYESPPFNSETSEYFLEHYSPPTNFLYLYDYKKFLIDLLTKNPKVVLQQLANECIELNNEFIN